MIYSNGIDMRFSILYVFQYFIFWRLHVKMNVFVFLPLSILHISWYYLFSLASN